MNSAFKTMSRRNGGYSLPYLIKIYDPTETLVMFFINDTQDKTYNGQTYIASTFKYTPNASEYGLTGGGSLEIAVKDTQVIDLIESYKEIKLDVIGILNKADGNVNELRTYKHHYCDVSCNRTTATFTFTKDDRLNMTFPALIWNAANNRGNA